MTSIITSMISSILQNVEPYEDDEGDTTESMEDMDYLPLNTRILEPTTTLFYSRSNSDSEPDSESEGYSTPEPRYLNDLVEPDDDSTESESESDLPPINTGVLSGSDTEIDQPILNRPVLTPEYDTYNQLAYDLYHDLDLDYDLDYEQPRYQEYKNNDDDEYDEYDDVHYDDDDDEKVQEEKYPDDDYYENIIPIATVENIIQQSIRRINSYEPYSELIGQLINPNLFPDRSDYDRMVNNIINKLNR